MSNVALSLSLFNLIPFPRTDGSILLTSLLHLHRVKTPTTPPLPLRTTLSTTGRSTPPNPRINLNAYKEYELNSGDEDGDEEDGRGGGVGGRKKEVGWRRRVKRIVEFGCMGLGVGWALGWGMLGLLRSS
jgi:S2P endopeptidase